MASDELEELERGIEGRVLRAPDALARYQRDGSHLVGSARAVVLPTGELDARRTLEWARRSRTPLVARGGGSSLDGESVPLAGGVVVDFSGWNRILEVDSAEGLARVEPGVVNRDLHRTLVELGWFFPPNPGSWLSSTLGGNAATNASGPRSFRYGPTRRWVRQAKVLLGTGEVVVVGHRSRKRSAGPELLDWLIGSEGTLGWFLELTVELAPLPDVRTGLIVAKPSSAPLGELAARRAFAPALCARVHRRTVRARALATHRESAAGGQRPTSARARNFPTGGNRSSRGAARGVAAGGGHGGPSRLPERG